MHKLRGLLGDFGKYLNKQGISVVGPGGVPPKGQEST